MIDYKKVLKEPYLSEKQLLSRGYKIKLDNLQDLESSRLELLKRIEILRRERNIGSNKIKEIKNEDFNRKSTRIKELQVLGEKIKVIEDNLNVVLKELDDLLKEIPNLPSAMAPVGENEKDNEVVNIHGMKPILNFLPNSHNEIGEKLGVFDFKKAAKITGSRFSLLKGKGALLEQALKNMMFDLAVKENSFIPVSVPLLVNKESMTNTGQLPKFEEDLFKTNLGNRDYYLIPTAEVPIVNIHSNESIDKKELPIKYCALTPCFRSEAGSAGRDTKGLIRQHQFEKMELVCFSTPEDSWSQLENMRSYAEKVLQRLGLHYRVVSLCTGDLPFASKFTYDIEVWMPSQNEYREVSSCSTCGDFQARRGNITYQTDKVKEYVHTLNGSAMPLGRILAAIFEQYQKEDGSVVIPEELQKYTGFEIIKDDQ